MAQKKVLVIGAGIAGITVALELAEMGIPSILLERRDSIGGESAKLCCQATDSCHKCFACIVDKRVEEVGHEDLLSIMTGAELADFSGDPGNFDVTIRKNDQRVREKAAALVVATGFEPYDAMEKMEYGYGRFLNVITAMDLDEILRNGGKAFRPSDGAPLRKVAFFQCVGSRDASIGHIYCSQVCCTYALRLAKTLRYQDPQIEISFFYMDIQPAGRSFGDLLQSCREDEGIRFIRSLPSKVYGYRFAPRLRVRLPDSEKGELIEEGYDLIVLSVGIAPRKDAEAFATLLGLAFNEEGFYRPPPPNTGIFTAGTCAGPKDISGSITHAQSVIVQVEQFLRGV